MHGNILWLLKYFNKLKIVNFNIFTARQNNVYMPLCMDLQSTYFYVIVKYTLEIILYFFTTYINNKIEITNLNS